MPVETPHTPQFKNDFLFHALMRAHFNAQAAGLSKRGLPNLGSPKILFALMDLAEQNAPPPSQKELADILHISPATVANSLKSMERSGYIARQTDERDSRRNLITITEKGLHALLTSREVFEHVDKYMFNGFTQEERDQVFSLHQRMLRNLYQIGGDVDVSSPPPPPTPLSIERQVDLL